MMWIRRFLVPFVAISVIELAEGAHLRDRHLKKKKTSNRSRQYAGGDGVAGILAALGYNPNGQSWITFGQAKSDCDTSQETLSIAIEDNPTLEAKCKDDTECPDLEACRYVLSWGKAITQCDSDCGQGGCPGAPKMCDV